MTFDERLSERKQKARDLGRKVEFYFEFETGVKCYVVYPDGRVLFVGIAKK